MDLPFSRPEFFSIFSEYNRAIWPLHAVAMFAGLVAVAVLFVPRAWPSRAVMAIVAVLWAITGIGYHWLYFSEINPAAYAFGALFILEAGILIWEGVIRFRMRIQLSPPWQAALALLLILYALIVYPLVGLFISHPYPETPLFGVTPCPTTIFTFGVLMLMRHPRPLLAATIPLLWAVAGGSAAVVLSVPQDWGLPIAGVLFLSVYLAQAYASKEKS